jgi:hypothetical protein
MNIVSRVLKKAIENRGSYLHPLPFHISTNVHNSRRLIFLISIRNDKKRAFFTAHEKRQLLKFFWRHSFCLFLSDLGRHFFVLSSFAVSLEPCIFWANAVQSSTKILPLTFRPPQKGRTDRIEIYFSGSPEQKRQTSQRQKNSAKFALFFPCENCCSNLISNANNIISVLLCDTVVQTFGSRPESWMYICRILNMNLFSAPY